MKVISMSNVIAQDNKYLNSFLESHKRWIEGYDDLQEDVIYVLRLSHSIIWNKVDAALKRPLTDIIEISGEHVYRINFSFNNLIESKNDASVVICGDNASIGILYKGKIDSDAALMKKKRNLLSDFILRVGREKYGDKRIKPRRRENTENQIVRNDIILDGKKISGIDIIEDGKRFEACAVVQNNYTEKEKATIEKFMSVDPHWEKSYGKRAGITGLEVNFDEFVIELNEMAAAIVQA